MTAVLSAPPASQTVAAGWIGRPRLLHGIDRGDLTSYPVHLAEHGPLPLISRDGLLGALDAVGLTGRGGAAFPLATKLRGLRSGAEPVVVVNAAEGEPASAKDQVLLSSVPHQVLDGAAVVAEAIGARRVLVAVTNPGLTGPVQRAIAGRHDAARFELRLVADRFIAGEASALISALNGGAGLPAGRRVLPTVHGVSGAPTVLSNAETFAQVAVLLRLGPVGYRAVGTPAEPGTTLLSVSGAVLSPGVLEVPLGVGLDQVASAVGAQPSQAIVIGGFHGSWLPASAAGVAVSRAGLAAAGGTLGAGAVMFLGQHSCPLAELSRVAQWLADQSAKQCGPCAFGLPALVADLRGAAAGQPAALAAAIRHAGQLTGRGACAHPDGAVRFVRSALVVLGDDLARHQARGSCGRRDLGDLSLSRARAFGGR